MFSFDNKYEKENYIETLFLNLKLIIQRYKLKKLFFILLLISVLLINLVSNERKEKIKDNQIILKTSNHNISSINNTIPTINFNHTNNTVHIAINIDNKYYYPCLVFLTSLLDNRKNSTFYQLHILKGNGLNESLYEKISTIVNQYGNNHIHINYHDMNDQFKKATHGRYISIADYYRIALPSLLPTVDKIIYIDTDVINFKDLTEMYSLEFKDDIYLLGTLDKIYMLNELKKQFQNVTRYMNAGILLMNLKSMRKYRIEEKIRAYVRTHFLNHHDQTAINAVCHDNFDILSIKYGCFSFNKFEDIVSYNDKQDESNRYSLEELKQAFYEPTLLHFVGYVKPWEKKCKNENQKYWWYYAKKSGFYEEISKFYGFNEKDVEEMLKKIPENGGLLRRSIKNL